MQKLGQHFLRNQDVIQKIISALDLQENDAVIEIGPGHGELTVPLLEACSLAHASLLVIEKDKALADSLENKNGGGNGLSIKMEIFRGDALKILPEVIEGLRSAKARRAPEGNRATTGNLKLVGNIPYYITGKLLRIISELDKKPERNIFMVQQEVAERIVAAPPAMNRLAASVQFWADGQIIALVPKNDFSPPPKVDSAVIELKAKSNDRGMPAAERFYGAVRAIFAQPRKTLVNNLAAAEKPKKDIPKSGVLQELVAIGISPEARPQDLSLDQIALIAKRLF